MSPGPPAPIDPQVRTAKLHHLVNGLIVLGLFGYSLATYTGLPERIPIHFDAAGVADGWMDKGWLAWLALPLTALGMWALMALSAGLVGWARKHPKYLSMPNKEKFLALPPEKQEPVWRQMKATVHWMAAPVNAMLFYAQISIHRVASSGASEMAVWPLFACLGGMLIATIWLTVRLVRTVKQAVDAH